jgi:outer membrane protein OmpA-like peptidoglycan-associated protein
MSDWAPTTLQRGNAMENKITCLTKNSRVAALAVLALFLSACSATRPADPWKCALVGAGIGGAGGAAVGALNGSDGTLEKTLIGTGAGVAAGALAGYTMCALMPEAAAPAPPPPPPAAKPEPVVRKTVVLPGVNFAFNSADLLPASKEVLDREVIPELKADPELQVLIEGHTDSVGSDLYNEKLSGARAGSVWKYLNSNGIEASRMQAKGYGESQPIASNDTAEGRTKNRRVEIKELK